MMNHFLQRVNKSKQLGRADARRCLKRYVAEFHHTDSTPILLPFIIRQYESRPRN